MNIVRGGPGIARSLGLEIRDERGREVNRGSTYRLFGEAQSRGE